jgi:hypothetical protein
MSGSSGARFAFSVAVITATGGCRHCGEHDSGHAVAERDDDRATDEGEDSDEARESFWRASVVIVGSGRVTTAVKSFDCVSNGEHQSGQCGPSLVRFAELSPPLLLAEPAAHWHFSHWESVLHEPDGTTRSRSMAWIDGPLYMNAFGYRDTGELETVTAVFVRDAVTDATP